ncbi:MAG: 3-ketoacyl-ACP reductase, partial [Nocardioidaceae bacterium]|nr:3-ketoacyl-ACP reductase [Nocardioidaceae bacterium]
RGIGLGIAEHLVREGATVCITARNEDALIEAVAGLGGPEVAMYVAGKGDDVEHQADAVRRTTEAFGPVDVLVNNAGINPVYGPLMDLDLAAGRKILEVNVLAALSWTQQVVRTGLADRGGSVVNVASLAGVRPAPGIDFYGVSKRAMIGLTESLAVELGPTIRVNAVAPAVVKTKFAEALYVGREDEVAAAYPLKRLGVPDDIGSVVAFLASPGAGWMTGQTIVLDGGVSLTGGA